LLGNFSYLFKHNTITPPRTTANVVIEAKALVGLPLIVQTKIHSKKISVCFQTIFAPPPNLKVVFKNTSFLKYLHSTCASLRMCW